MLVHGLLYVHYVGFVLGRLCLVGNCGEPLGKVSFHLHATVANLSEQVGVASKARE